MDAMDEAIDCCANIAAMAALLEASGGVPEPDAVNPTVVSRTGQMIGCEVEKLHELVGLLDRALAKPARRR